jgi:hypothetical protein
MYITTTDLNDTIYAVSCNIENSKLNLNFFPFSNFRKNAIFLKALSRLFIDSDAGSSRA